MSARSSADKLAEWSKALRLGRSPKGRGFESHICHYKIDSLTSTTPEQFFPII